MASVLIVDDEPLAREVLRETVTLLGHEPDEAADGVEALERFRELQHDVVITDLTMPRMDGLELTDQLHKLDPLLPILVVTGRDSLDLKAMAWSRGIADFVSKPFRMSALQRTLDEAVRSRTTRDAGSPDVEARTGLAGLLPFLLAFSALLTLLLLWLYWDHLLDLQSLSHLVPD